MSETSTDPRRRFGDSGEDWVVAHLRAQGWAVLDRNWRCREGEIDIVGWDEFDRCVVFVEVKTRRSTTFGRPVEAVNWAKLARLRKLGAIWLRAHPGAPRARVDVVGLVVAADGSVRDVEHLRDVAS